MVPLKIETTLDTVLSMRYTIYMQQPKRGWLNRRVIGAAVGGSALVVGYTYFALLLLNSPVRQYCSPHVAGEWCSPQSIFDGWARIVIVFLVPYLIGLLLFSATEVFQLDWGRITHLSSEPKNHCTSD